jgi:GR25 family glycosyltransferase involved in LPS biosynthesis
MSDNTPFSLIEHILYINLEHRTDRLAQVQSEFKDKLKINSAERFPAIKHEKGPIGCALSHIKCLEIAKERNYPFVFICEDDIEFLNPEYFLYALKKFENAPPPGWNVFLVSGNSLPPYQQYSATCIKTINCQTTTGYITHYSYYDRLIKNYKDGVELLLENPDKTRIYAIDQYWKHLQAEQTWYLMYPPCVIQRAGYSDIEKKYMDYTNLMLDIEKRHMFRKPNLNYLK